MTQNRHYASVLCLQHVPKCACFTSFYVGNSSEIRTFRSQMHVFYVSNMSHNVCVLNVPVFVFNTSCNVTLSCCFTSQYFLNTLVTWCKYVRNSCVLFSNASVLRLQQACNAHLSCRFYVAEMLQTRP